MRASRIQSPSGRVAETARASESDSPLFRPPASPDVRPLAGVSNPIDLSIKTLEEKTLWLRGFWLLSQIASNGYPQKEAPAQAE